MNWGLSWGEDWETSFTGSWQQAVELLEWLPKLGALSEIWLNELVSWSVRKPIFEALLKAKRETGAKLILLFHDYYSLCPSYALMDVHDRFCGLPDAMVCATCLPQIPYADSPAVSECQGLITGWRKIWGDFLAGTDEVIFFSAASEKLFRKVYTAYSGSARLIPHQPQGDFPDAFHRASRNGPITIGVVGAITVHKGAKIIAELDEIWQQSGKTVNIVIIGDLLYGRPTPRMTVTGRYQRKQLPALLTQHQVDCVLVPSVWPETFCYVVQELMMLSVPVACFNFGAQAERVDAYDKGLVMALDAGSAAVALLAFATRMRIRA